jgi:hypothetical protein
VPGLQAYDVVAVRMGHLALEGCSGRLTIVLPVEHRWD